MVPLSGICRESDHFRAVGVLEPTPAAAAGFRGVAHDEVGVDDQVGTHAIARRYRAKRWQAIRVSRYAARGIDIGSAHDNDSAAIGCDRRVETLVEHDRIVFDEAILDESKVPDASAVTRAQIAAYPIVVEFVVVGAGTDADAACPRRGGGEQFAGRGA